MTDVEKAAEVAAEIGYPILIKAVHGGGGKGIQLVNGPEEFEQLFYRVNVEARSAFGNGDVYLEKYVTSLRHIEAQLLRDVHGNLQVLEFATVAFSVTSKTSKSLALLCCRKSC